MATSEVIWDSTPVPEKRIKTKEIPFREKIMPKETSCLDLISHPTCLKLELIKQGNLRVEIHFSEALTTTINVIMYAEFDNVIEIFLFDYSA
jgi:hypothetical protein